MASKSKRIVALLLTAMMATTALVGCSSEEDSGSSSSGSKKDNSSAAEASKSDTSKSETSQESSGGKGIDFDDEAVMTEIRDQLANEASKKGSKTITLRLWCAGDDLAFEKSLVKEFQEKFADTSGRYEWKITTVTKGEDEAGGKVLEAPKKAADVFNFADDQLADLNTASAISTVPEFYRSAVEGENSADAIAVSKIGNDLFAYPKTSDNGFFLYYDKRILTDDDVKEFDTMISKSAAAGKNVYMNLSGPWYNAGFFFAAGCTIEFRNGVQTATLDTPEGLSAAKAMCHLAESQGKGFIGSPGTLSDNAYVSQGFANGELSAAVIGTWEGPAIKKAIGEENVGAAKLPTVLMGNEQKQLHSFGGYKLIGVNVFTDYPFAAHTLAYFLHSEKSQIKRYNTRGLIPTNNKATSNEKIKKDPAFQAIADQRTYAHAQGKSVGGIYWGAGTGSVGGDIVNAKGKLSDDELMAKLKGCVENMKKS